MDTRTAVENWIGGWIISRGAADPVAAPWGWTVDVGQPKHVFRHVVPDPDEATVRKLVADTRASGVWLKLFAEDAVVRPWLGPGWHFDEPGFLMTVPLAEAAPAVPAGYRLTTWTRVGVTRALVRTADGDHFAARGQIAVNGAVAVADQIETSPAHRRRGLGSVVMRTLQTAAASAGARTGVLVGTSDGQALYTALGWRTLSPMASLHHAPESAA
ncbi:GNAT family N-acetyltransferase [Streptomyces sp. NPDC060194]|uniref:GNAT family N-acetyltransferase n=1 Tax=Streptomyces sp. NPDC060194 TaxID=3347069 RepID=UPI00365E290C